MKQFRFSQEKQTIQKVPVYATPSFFYGHKGAFWGNRNVLKLDCIKGCIIINLPKPLILCFQWLNFMIYKWSFNKPVKYIFKKFFSGLSQGELKSVTFVFSMPYYRTILLWLLLCIANRWGENGNSDRLYFLRLQNHCKWSLQPWN